MDKSEALRLADALMDYYKCSDQDIDEAAAELRRLHAENASLRAALASSCDEQRHELWESGGIAGCERARVAERQRDALLEALLRIESAVDWYLGRSSFTQTTQLKGLKHSVNVRKELFAAHDEVRAAIKAVEEGK